MSKTSVRSKTASVRSFLRRRRRREEWDKRLKPFGFCCSLDDFDPLSKYGYITPRQPNPAPIQSVDESPVLKLRTEYVHHRDPEQRRRISKIKFFDDGDQRPPIELESETRLFRKSLQWCIEDEFELAKDLLWEQKRRTYNEVMDRNATIGKRKSEMRLAKLSNVHCPRWYQDFSNDQMKNLMMLDEVLLKDYEEMVTGRTQRTLMAIGVVSTFFKISPTDIRRLQVSCDHDALGFLREVYKILTGSYFEQEGHKKSYDCNERIILSAIAFLTLPETVIELHERLPAVTVPELRPKPLPPAIPIRPKTASPYREELFTRPDWASYLNALQSWQEYCKLRPVPRIFLPAGQLRITRVTLSGKKKQAKFGKLEEPAGDRAERSKVDRQGMVERAVVQDTSARREDQKEARTEKEMLGDNPRLPDEEHKFEFTINGLSEKPGPIEYKICGTINPPQPNKKSWLGDKDAHYIISGATDEPPSCPVTYEMTGVANVTPTNSDEKFFSVLKLGDGPRKIYPKGRKNLSKNWQEWLQNADEEYKKVEREANKLIKNIEATMRLVFPGPICDSCCSCRQTRKSHIKWRETKAPHFVIDTVAVDSDKNKYIVGSMAMHSPAPSPPESTVNLLEVIASEDKVTTNLMINGVTNKQGETQYFISGLKKDTIHVPSRIVEPPPPRPLRNVPPCVCAVHQIFNKGLSPTTSKDDIRWTKDDGLCFGKKYRPGESPAFSCKMYPGDKSCRRNPFTREIEKLKRKRKRARMKKDEWPPPDKPQYSIAEFKPCGDEHGMGVCGEKWGEVHTLTKEELAEQERIRKEILRGPPCGEKPGRAVCEGPWGAKIPLPKKQKLTLGDEEIIGEEGVEEEEEEEDEEEEEEEVKEEVPVEEVKEKPKKRGKECYMSPESVAGRKKVVKKKVGKFIPDPNYHGYDDLWNIFRTAPTEKELDTGYEKTLKLSTPQPRTTESRLERKKESPEDDEKDEEVAGSERFSKESSRKISKEGAKKRTESGERSQKISKEGARKRPESGERSQKISKEDAKKRPESSERSQKISKEGARKRPDSGERSREVSKDGARKKPESTERKQKISKEDSRKRPESSERSQKISKEDSRKRPESSERSQKISTEDSRKRPESSERSQKISKEDSRKRPESSERRQKISKEDSRKRPESSERRQKISKEDSKKRPESSERKIRSTPTEVSGGQKRSKTVPVSGKDHRSVKADRPESSKGAKRGTAGKKSSVISTPFQKRSAPKTFAQRNGILKNGSKKRTSFQGIKSKKKFGTETEKNKRPTSKESKASESTDKDTKKAKKKKLSALLNLDTKKGKMVDQMKTLKRDKKKDLPDVYDLDPEEDRKRQLERIKTMMMSPETYPYPVEPAIVPEETRLPCKTEHVEREDSHQSVEIDTEAESRLIKKGPCGWRTKSEQELPTKKTLTYLTEPDYPLETIPVRPGGKACVCRENRNKKKILLYNIGGLLDKKKTETKQVAKLLRKKKDEEEEKRTQVIDGVVYFTPPPSPRRSEEYVPEYDLYESPYDMCLTHRKDRNLKLLERHAGPGSPPNKLQPCGCNDYIETFGILDETEDAEKKRAMAELDKARKEAMEGKTPQEQWNLALKDPGLVDYFTRCRDNLPCWLHCNKFNKDGCSLTERKLKLKRPVCECKYERKILERKEVRTKWKQRQEKLKSLKKKAFKAVADISRPIEADTKLLISGVKRIPREDEYIDDIKYCVTGVAQNYSMAPPQQIVQGVSMSTPFETPEPSKHDIKYTGVHRHWSPMNIPPGPLPRPEKVLMEEKKRRREAAEEAYREIHKPIEALDKDHRHSCKEPCNTETVKSRAKKEPEEKTPVPVLKKDVPVERSTARQPTNRLKQPKAVDFEGKRNVVNLRPKQQQFRDVVKYSQGEPGTKSGRTEEDDLHQQDNDSIDEKSQVLASAKHQLMNTVKEELKKMAEEGFVFAKLPRCFMMPQLQDWLMYRQGISFSEQDKYKLVRNSVELWNMIDTTRTPKIQVPSFDMSKRQLDRLTFDDAKLMKNKIAENRAKFYSEVRKARVLYARSMWGTMEYGKFPSKSFKEAFFTYMAAKEADGHVFRPWFTSEVPEKN